MIPVDEGKIFDAFAFSSFPISAHTSLHARKPAGPVAQFAFPEFTTTARTRPLERRSELRPTSTGAATTRFLVKTAAACVEGPAQISARSALPLALMPAVTAENSKPLGRKIGSDAFILAVSPASWRVPEESQTSEARLSPSPPHRNCDNAGTRSNLC